MNNDSFITLKVAILISLTFGLLLGLIEYWSLT